MRAPDLILAHPLLLGHGDVHGQQDGSGGVDGHGSGDFVQRNLPEKDLHVRERVDGHPTLADFSPAQGVIGIPAHEGRHVEGSAESGLPLGQKVTKPLVGFLRGSHSSEHAHGPKPTPVHVGLNSSGVRVLAREPDFLPEVVPLDVQRGVKRLNLHAGNRREPFPALAMKPSMVLHFSTPAFLHFPGLFQSSLVWTWASLLGPVDLRGWTANARVVRSSTEGAS